MQFWVTIAVILVLSAVGLTYEIAAGRVLAPFFGTSLVTWTAVIATVRGEIHSYKAPYSDRAPHRIQMFDGTGFLTLTFFRAEPRWLQGQFPIGKERIVSGQVGEFQGERQMSHPDYIIDPKSGQLPPPVEPIYGLTAGLTNKRVHQACKAALELIPDDLPEWIDEELKTRSAWPDFKSALCLLHAPERYDLDAFEAARQRLAYDEALARETVFAFARMARIRKSAPPLSGSNDLLNQISGKLPYKMTEAQRRAVREHRAGDDGAHRDRHREVEAGHLREAPQPAQPGEHDERDVNAERREADASDCGPGGDEPGGHSGEEREGLAGGLGERDRQRERARRERRVGSRGRPGRG